MPTAIYPAKSFLVLFFFCQSSYSFVPLVHRVFSFHLPIRRQSRNYFACVGVGVNTLHYSHHSLVSSLIIKSTMAAQPVRQWGVTPPISMTLPAPEEVAANDDLIAELKAQNNFESPSETEHRKQSLQLMQRVTIEFIKAVSKRKGLSQAAVEASGGKIFTYGSYRLGVYGPGSF